jgi:hypothetical protein
MKSGVDSRVRIVTRSYDEPISSLIMMTIMIMMVIMMMMMMLKIYRMYFESDKKFLLVYDSSLWLYIQESNFVNWL